MDRFNRGDHGDPDRVRLTLVDLLVIEISADIAMIVDSFRPRSERSDQPKPIEVG